MAQAGAAGASGTSYNLDITKFVAIGLAGIEDPPKVGVRQAVQRANAAGVRVTMITGDHQDTAR